MTGARTAPSHRPPLAAQYLAAALAEVPAEIARYPLSRDFRTAMDAWADARGIPFRPTRGDLERGIAWLTASGRLPEPIGGASE